MNVEVFNLIHKNKFIKIYDLIENNILIDLDIKDKTNNYFINYIVLYNKINIFKLILSKRSNINIRLDIVDIDGRTILYYCIKYNHTKLIKLLLEYDKLNIGISIINIKDKLGQTALHYCILFFSSVHPSR
jgi:ankyrin repeat protein